MPSPRNLLCAAFVAGVMLAAPQAEARFGKKSSSSSSSSDSSSSSSSDSSSHSSGSSHSSSSSSRVHDATPVGQESDRPHDSGYSGRSDNGGGRHRGRHGGGEYYSDGYYEPPVHVFSWWHRPSIFDFIWVTSEPTYVVAPEVQVQQQREPSTPLTLRTGVNGGALGGGVAVDAFAGLEGERLGVEGRYTHLGLPTDDGSSGQDEIGLLEVHLTAALWASERGRLRAEAGFSSAQAPDITMIGPSFGLSSQAVIAGPLDLEARVQLTPLPYRQLDASAGLAVHLSALTLRGGWRGLVLDDQGQVDGEQHVDAMGGPYVGLGFVF